MNPLRKAIKKHEKLIMVLTFSIILWLNPSVIFAASQMATSFATSVGTFLNEIYGVVKIICIIAAAGCVVSIAFKINKDNNDIKWEVIGVIVFVGLIFAIPALVKVLTANAGATIDIQ